MAAYCVRLCSVHEYHSLVTTREIFQIVEYF
jgi:hypothetical protein